jgi:hypothetical protein
MVFIDIENTYDNVPRNINVVGLIETQSLKKYITLIKDMYDNIVTSVRTSDRDTNCWCLESQTSKIEQCVESSNGACDENKDLYWFRLPERNTLRPVWKYVSFIDLRGLKYEAHNGREYKLMSVAENVFFMCPSSSSHGFGHYL